ncbi:MAG: hypothetical protein V1694_00050 [Candidatus Eisenbacteria bacterium]
MGKTSITKLLTGREIALSISESPDLEVLGLSLMHLQDAMVEFARYLFAADARIFYGGDLRPGGFTEILFNLVRTYPPSVREGESNRSVVSYLAWPLWLRVTNAQKADILGLADIRELGPPTGLVSDEGTYLEPDSTENRFVWARCLTAMREAMNRDLDARIVLGGRLTGFQGCYPGILEETLLALRDGKPVYVLGGFGGCVAEIAQALEGKMPKGLTESFQFEYRGYHDLADYYNQRVKEDASIGPPIDYQEVLGVLHRTGAGGLGNGLTKEENQRLFRAVHVPELIALVLKGLSQLFEGGGERRV